MGETLAPAAPDPYPYRARNLLMEPLQVGPSGEVASQGGSAAIADPRDPLNLAFGGGLTPTQLASAHEAIGNALGWAGTFIGEQGAANLARAGLPKYSTLLEFARGAEGPVKPGAIRWATGWFRDPRGDWKYEMTDEGARLGPAWQVGEIEPGSRMATLPENVPTIDWRNPSATPVTARDLLAHDLLYRAYPELGNIPAYAIDPLAEYTGIFGPNLGYIAAAANGPSRVRGTLLHEMQHGVQDIEGFSPGTSPEAQLPPSYYPLKNKMWDVRYDIQQRMGKQGLAPDLFESMMGARQKMMSGQELNPAEQRVAAYIHQGGLQSAIDKLIGLNTQVEAMEAQSLEDYRRAYGEAEARSTTSRQNLTEEQRRWMPDPALQRPDLIALPPRAASARLVPVEHDPFAESLP